jgi:multidrug efflux pump subunit AcrB
VFSRFFIDRPIFASVLSIVITLAGFLSLRGLPLAQFPRVSPPTVQVTCTYPGASAKDVAEAVAAPIEQEVNGVEGMMYMSSTSANDGSYNLTVTFKPGVELNMAQVLVQNRVNLAVPKLPDVIKQTGVTTLKKSPDILMGMAINSPNGRYDQVYLSNYALRFIKDELARIKGVGDVFLFGQRDYSMRIWVDPNKLATRGLTAMDVVNAIQEQNAAVATGTLGQPPTKSGQEQQFTFDTLGRLKSIKDFEDIILRSEGVGRLRVKDVARVQLGAKNQDISCRMDGKDTVFLAVFQLPDANALETHQLVLDKMNELSPNFPEGLTYDVAFDTTPYTSESITEVFKTLRDAIILVAIVVLVFLQNWRSAIIPLIAVPVAIIGTFAVMAAFGFSLNNLTLFGLVLAIGIVVDDAIVVVEAVEHHIEHGLAPRAATIKAMEQVSGPVVAVGLVLSAVFVPCAFISGITGEFFRQFALTISASTIISAFNSLTLSPALTALLLKPQNKGAAPPLPRLAFVIVGALAGYYFLAPVLDERLSGLAEARDWLPDLLGVGVGVAAGWLVGRPLNFVLRGAFVGFNQGVRHATEGYVWAVGKLLRFSTVALVVYGGLVLFTAGMYTQTPRGFIPNQDMGYLMASIQLPDAASTERTEEVMARVGKIARSAPGVRHATTIVGSSFFLNANAPNFASMFVNLKNYEDRRDPSLSSDAILARLRMEFATKIQDADVQIVGPPPVRGAGRGGGFAIMIEDRGDLGPAKLQEQVDTLCRLGNQVTPADAQRLAELTGRPDRVIAAMFTAFRANVPQLKIDPDRATCMARGVRLQDFADTLNIYQGSLYVNDFNLFDRTWQVNVQADAQYRDRVEQLYRLSVRNQDGDMVPLGSLANIRRVTGPLVMTRYNMRPAAQVNGGVIPNTLSSDQTIKLVERMANDVLSPNVGYEWTDMQYLEIMAGGAAWLLFGFGVVMVFLVLAAQYESWSLPLAVILVVPMCLLSAIAGVNIAGMDINIFTQIGFVVLVGLASKNAILIVEFAKRRREAGAPRDEATLEACRLRLRPILMTSLAFILGVLPLMVSKGAGAEMRQTLGTAVFYGMLGVTLFGIFLTPVFFFVINRLSEARHGVVHVPHRARAAALRVLVQGYRQVSSFMARRPRPTQVPANGNGNGNGAEAAPTPTETKVRR